MNQPTNEELDALRQFDSCRIANAIETFDVRLRNEGFARPGLKWMAPSLPPMLGYAVTSHIKTLHPHPDGRSYLDRTDWWRELRQRPNPRIAVIEDIDDLPAFGAVGGEVHLTILQKLGCAGLVTNGCVRDLPALEKMGFPVLARDVSPSHSYAHIVDYGLPVTICGLRVISGDLIFADPHGMVSIPLELVAKLPAAIREQGAREQRVIDICRSPDFSLERLEAAVRESV